VEIKISARHGSLSEATQAKLSAKLEKLARLFERLTTIDVTVDLEHHDAPILDVKVSVEHRPDFLASCQAADLMAATDAVIHKLEQQLRKHKDKVQERHRSPGHRQQEAPPSPSPEASL
jgi:putative sigma-54 modulation protein